MQQGSEEWVNARLGMATASRFADVMATLRSGEETAARANYKAQLVVERVTNLPVDGYISPSMEWGMANEELAATVYQLRRGVSIQKCGFITHATLDAGASPDRLCGEDGLIEIKCPNTATHIKYLADGSLPSKYKAQVQGQLWITERKWCDFVSYDPRMPDHAAMMIVRVNRDDEYITKLEKEVEKFLIEVGEQEIFIRTFQPSEVEV